MSWAVMPARMSMTDIPNTSLQRSAYAYRNTSEYVITVYPWIVLYRTSVTSAIVGSRRSNTDAAVGSGYAS